MILSSSPKTPSTARMQRDRPYRQPRSAPPDHQTGKQTPDRVYMPAPRNLPLRSYAALGNNTVRSTRLPIPPRLQRKQMRIPPVPPHQLLMTPILNHPPMIQHS